MSEYRVAYSNQKCKYGVGRDKLIHDDFSVFELYPPGYIFADQATAQRVANELNDRERSQK